MSEQHDDGARSSRGWDPTSVYGACVFTGIVGLVGTFLWAVVGGILDPLFMLASPVSLLAAAVAFGLLSNATRRP